MNRLIVYHEEIKGFMAAMEMSYPVAPPTLLQQPQPGRQDLASQSDARQIHHRGGRCY